MPDTTGLLGEVAHPGRPKDEEPHIKRSVKKKQEVIDYLVRVDLRELGIDETNFEVGCGVIQLALSAGAAGALQVV